MIVALVQPHIDWENKEKNIRNADRIIKKQSENGTELILFPEMSFTGFSMDTKTTAENNRETVALMSDMAERYNIAVGFGWVKNCGILCENIYTIVNAEGSIVSEYTKIHPFSFSGENEKFRGGDNITIYSIGDIMCSTFICYDLRFPEVFRLAADDVHAVIIPACWPAKRSEHWKTLLRARAIENQIYVFAINCVGKIGGMYYSGDSCVINPNGDILKMLSDVEGIIIYNFEDDVCQYRNNFPVLKDRKSITYQFDHMLLPDK